MKRIVILGSGTGVGKTFVTAALARALRELGLDCVALKPVETGYAEHASSDAHALEAASGHALGDHPLYRFAEPVSPHLAARRSGVAVELAAIVEWVSRAPGEIALIETAGGALSPISDTATNLDLARALEPAILVLIAPDALGVLHDVRATVVAMRTLLREPDQIALSRARPADDSTGHNAGELARFGLAPCAVIGAEPAHDVLPLARALAETAAGTHRL